MQWFKRRSRMGKLVILASIPILFICLCARLGNMINPTPITTPTLAPTIIEPTNTPLTVSTSTPYPTYTPPSELTATPVAPVEATPTAKPAEATPTPIPLTPTLVPTITPAAQRITSYQGVKVGMPADDVLNVWGKGLRSEQVGSDAQGLIVEWVYEDAILVMKRWEIGGVTCYRVAEIRLR